MLAGDVAQELGLVGGNLDQLTGAGAAVEPAGAVLAVLAALVLDVAKERQELGVLAMGVAVARLAWSSRRPPATSPRSCGSPNRTTSAVALEPHHLGGDRGGGAGPGSPIAAARRRWRPARGARPRRCLGPRHRAPAGPWRGRGARTAPGHPLAGDGGGRNLGASTSSPTAALVRDVWLSTAALVLDVASMGPSPPSFSIPPIARLQRSWPAVKLAGAVLAVLALDRG